jgi:hypothetical protein
MWIIVAIVVGLLLGSTAAVGLVRQQQSTIPTTQIQAPLFDYGTR